MSSKKPSAFKNKHAQPTRSPVSKKTAAAFAPGVSVNKTAKSAQAGRLDPTKTKSEPAVGPRCVDPTAQGSPTQALQAKLQLLERILRDGRPVLAVVGGGAAGMAAALQARRAAPNAVVLLLESADRVGKKLLATGNGRCNLTHEEIAVQNYATHEPAVLAALPTVKENQTQRFFEELGLLCRSEEGRVYPWCGQAAMVLDVLRSALAQAEVWELCGCTVQGLKPQAQNGRSGFSLTLAVSEKSRAEKPEPVLLPSLFVDKVVLAAGGAAAPQLGGTQSGFVLAQQLGHSCTPLAPGLVGLRCREKGDVSAKGGILPGLKGLRVQAEAALVTDTTDAGVLESHFGEIQFNENGFSGIPVLQLSLQAALQTSAKQPLLLRLDLLPQLQEASLAQLLKNRCQNARPGQTLEELLLGTVPKKLGFALMKKVGLQPLTRPLSEVQPVEIKALAHQLKSWALEVTGTQGWEGAQTTVGGIPLSEVQPQTLESCRCKGLYLAGEVLDAAGQCGGYNLAWAFDTGLRAGQSAGQSLL